MKLPIAIALLSLALFTPLTLLSLAMIFGISIAGVGTASAGTKPDVSRSLESPAWDVSDYSGFSTGKSYIEAYPAQTDFTNYPEFSWDKIPRWLAVRNKDALTPEQLNSIARNHQVVLLEKSNLEGKANTEEGTRWAARELKKRNPLIKVFFYWNTVVYYGGYAANAAYHPDDWSEFTRKADGTKEYRLIRGKLRTFNHDIPEMQKWWVDTALGMGADPNIDGVFLDKVGGGDKSMVDANGKLKAHSNYVDSIIQLSERLPKGKLLIGNSLRNERPNGNREIMRISAGSYFERWNLPMRGTEPKQTEAEAICVTIQLMREALSKGKIVMLQSGFGNEKAVTDEKSTGQFAEGVDFPLAVFLIAAEKHAYFSYQGSVNAQDPQWKWDPSHLEKLNRPLGRPLGAPIKNGYIYTRSFEHGDVWVNVETKETRFPRRDAPEKPSVLPNAIPTDRKLKP